LKNKQWFHSGVFGIRKYGSHLNGYIIENDGTLKMWIGQRSKTKQTFPSMLDNLVRKKKSTNFDCSWTYGFWKAAGGLSHDLTPTECMVKECGEEAQIPKDLIEGKLKAVGAIRWDQRSDVLVLSPYSIYNKSSLAFVRYAWMILLINNCSIELKVETSTQRYHTEWRGILSQVDS